MWESLEASLVRLRTAEGRVVGAGFLVGERHILTCAHVVAGALGLADDVAEKPQAPVSLDVPRVAPRQLLTARVILWRPPRADGGDDIAGLELMDDPPQGAQAAPLAQVEDLWEHSFRAFGYPSGQDSGIWATGRLLGRQVTDWVQIEDVKETGFAVEPGFSGTPLWDTQVEAVVGMVVAAERRLNLKTAFAIPVDVLAKSWPLLESFIHPFVFLCYARADSQLVTRLKTDLLSQGIHVWIDREGLRPGTLDWEEALRTAIRAAQAVLLIASPNARSSRYVRDELRIAELYQRPVYPLWIAGMQWIDAVPLGWGGAQYIDARQSRYETAISELVDLLNKTSSTPAKALVLGFEPRNPYKGLRAFTGNDAHDFFGRGTLINELAATMEGVLVSEGRSQQCARLLTVIGPSGSGKSSAVMAGLLPRLREGRLPGSEQWLYLDPIMPGTGPIEALTLALSEHLSDKSLKAIREDLEDDSARGLHLLATKLAKRPGTKVVLLVDQFEELFTQTSSEDERRHFLDLLVTATTEPHGPVIVLLTLRADFYDRPMRYPLLYQLIQAHQIPVLPMAIHELREVIEKPAALPDVQLTFEGELVGDLLFEVQGQVGALPLLQFTLDQLFQRRNGRQLTLSVYRELGGVKGALARQAEETYTGLPSEEHRRLSRALFVRLIDPGASEQDTTRRRAALSEFSLTEVGQTLVLQEVIEAFIAVRLLTTNEIAGTTTIEVSHEALIREWPRLVKWLREAREDIRLQQTLSEDASEWQGRKKPQDRLYRGSQLKEAQAWAGRNTPSSNEVAFLHASAARRVRSVLSVFALLLLVIGSLGTTSWFIIHQAPDTTRVTNLLDDGVGSLRWAIDFSPPGSTITFDARLSGTIRLTSNDLIIGKNLTIRGPVAHPLMVSNGRSSQNVHVLPGYTVTFANLNFEHSTTKSGKIFRINSFIANEGTLTLINNTISGNTSISGAIANEGTLTLIDSTVSDNNAEAGPFSSGGGGITNEGMLTLTNSTISSNRSNSGGGGIENNGRLTLTNSTISGNTSTYGSGGIENNGRLTLTNSTVSRNSGHNEESVAGGIFNNNGVLILSNSTVSENSASGILVGGGINNNNGVLILSNSTISANSASGVSGFGPTLVGGGIYTENGVLAVSNSTISNNTSSSSGGGIQIRIPPNSALGEDDVIFKVDIIFSSIYGNRAPRGADIAIEDESPKQRSHVRIRNSIVANDPTHPGQDISGTLTSLGYSLFQDDSGATFDPSTRMEHSTDKMVSMSNLTRLFALPVQLRDNQGPTKTLALAPDSSAVDQIPLAACHSKVTIPLPAISQGPSPGNVTPTPIPTSTPIIITITTDQRGMKRPDGNEHFCDIGAYESVELPT